MAFTGQRSTQVSQAVHVSSSTIAIKGEGIKISCCHAILMNRVESRAIEVADNEFVPVLVLQL